MEENENKVVETTATPSADYEKMYKELLAEKDKLKVAFDKASSETAEYKRKLSEHLTAEEAERMAREEKAKEIEEELATLRTEKRVSTYNARMLDCGIESTKATELAKLLPDGIPSEFFEGIKAFIAEETSRIRADALKHQPTLTPGQPLQAQTVEDAENAKIRAWMGLK